MTEERSLTPDAPCSIEAEAAVISLCLTMGADMIKRVYAILRPEDFYSRAHEAIFRACINVHRKGFTPDIVTIANELKNTGKLQEAGDLTYVAQVINAAPGTANVLGYSKIVLDKSNLRKLITACREISAGAKSAKTITDGEFMMAAGSKIREITRVADRSAIVSNKEALREVFLKIQNANAKGTEITGLGTGLDSVDRITTGLHGKQLCLVCARPGVGKSARLLNIATSVLLRGVGVVFFSLEMTRTELIQRQIAQMSRIDASDLETGKLDKLGWTSVTSTVGKLAELPFKIDESPDLSIHQIRERAMGAIDEGIAEKRPIGLIVVDYAQRVRVPQEDKRKNRYEQIADIARGLKSLAKETDLPVVSAAQIKRIPEGRPGKRPTLDDLREGGDLEQEADFVEAHHRESMYDSKADPGISEVIILKNRSGKADIIVKVKWEPEYTSFRDMDPT